ncbi:MAG: hypothetical protein KBF88_16830 [Polyangiaceae bacterium]|nr:hypothetical protein [Polyangiaceae bacterium]
MQKRSNHFSEFRAVGFRIASLCVFSLLAFTGCSSDVGADDVGADTVSESGGLYQSGPLTAIDPALAELEFLELLNLERVAQGRAPLVRDRGLDPVSREWSGSMSAVYARTRTFRNPSAPNDCSLSALCHRPDFVARSRAVEPNAVGFAENVGAAGDVVKLHRAFVASAGHYANILGDSNRVGIGVVIDADLIWVTFNFLKGPAIQGPTGLESRVASGSVVNVGSARAFSALPAPLRVRDTRVLGIPVSAGVPYPVNIRAASPTLSEAEVVDVNVTAVSPASPGYLTVYPCSAGLPLASTLNFSAGQVIPNRTTVAVDAAGELCVFSSASTDVILDVTGSYGASGTLRYTPSDPVRLYDSRSVGKVGGGPFELTTGLATGDVASLNVTVTQPDGPGFLTAYPCGGAIPNASNLNFAAGQTVPNSVNVRVGTASRVCFFSSVSTHLIVDYQGGFTASGGALQAVVPKRIVDTREYLGTSRLKGGTVSAVRVGNMFGLPTTATSASLNVTVTRPASAGYLTVFPCGSALPNVSNLNFTQNLTIANAVISKLGSDGQICLFSSADTDVIVDLNGTFAP